MELIRAPYKKEFTTQLQSVGHIWGTPAGEIKVGDTMVWNWGATSKVLEVLKETTDYITFKTEAENFKGEMQTYERKLKKNRIVARPANELPQYILDKVKN